MFEYKNMPNIGVVERQATDKYFYHQWPPNKFTKKEVQLLELIL